MSRHSSYTLDGGLPGRVTGACRSPLSSGTVLTYLSAAATGVYTSAVLSAGQTIAAIPIIGCNVAHTSASSSANVTSTSTPIQSSRPSATLSPGASAGIGIGAAIGVIAIAGLTFYFVRRKRSSRSKNSLSGPLRYETTPARAPAQAASAPVYEMYHGTSKYGTYQTPELQGR